MFILLKIVAEEINIEIQKEQYCECFNGDLRNFLFVIVATYILYSTVEAFLENHNLSY
jgi:hypothetical protein